MTEFIARLDYVHRWVNVNLPEGGKDFARSATQLASAGSALSDGSLGEATPQFLRLSGIVQDAMTRCSHYVFHTAENLSSAAEAFELADGGNADDLEEKWHVDVEKWLRMTPDHGSSEPESTGLAGPGF